MSDNVPPSTSSATTASAFDSNAETTTVTAEIELPFDAGADDIRYELLNDYEKCLGRHEVTLTDLLRFHQKQEKAATKLTLNLEQAKKREESERKKAKELEQMLKEVIKDVNTTGAVDDCGSRQTLAGVDEMKKMVDDFKNKTNQLRRRKDDIDRRYAEAKAKEDETGNSNDDQKGKNEMENELDEELVKLVHDTDQIKGEIYDILRMINQNLAQLNRRLNTEYKVQEDSETITEIRSVLDTVLFDVSNVFESKRRLDDDVEDLQRQMEELEKHISHADKMLAFLDREVAKLLTVGGRKEAAGVNPKNYGQVIRFVEETFEILLSKLKEQNKEIDQLNNKRNEIEGDNECRQREHEQEMAGKRAKIDDLKRKIDNLNFQNELLRNELRRVVVPQSPAGNLSELFKTLVEIKDKVETSQQAANNQQIAALESQLQRTKVKNDDALKQLNELTNEINNMDDKLNDKRKELSYLKQKGDSRKMNENRKSDQLDQQIAKLTCEIDRLENELQQARKSPQAQQIVPRDDTDMNLLAQNERELNDRLKRLQRAEADRAELLDQLKKLQQQYRDVGDELNRGRERRWNVEDQLQDVVAKISKMERKLSREEGNQPTFLPQSIQFQPSTITCVGEATGGGQLKQLISSDAPPLYPLIAPSAQEIRKAPHEYSPPTSQYGTQTLGSSQSQSGSSCPGANCLPSIGSSHYDEQIRSLQDSKHSAESRRNSLLRKVEATRTASQSPSIGRESSSSQSRNCSRDFKGHSPATEDVQHDQGPSGISKSQMDNILETLKRRRRSRSDSAGQQPIQVRITPEFQMETRNSDNDEDAILYNVKGDLLLTIDPSTAESSILLGTDTTIGSGTRKRSSSESSGSSSSYPPITPTHTRKESQKERPTSFLRQDVDGSKQNTDSKRRQRGSSMPVSSSSVVSDTNEGQMENKRINKSK